MSSRRSIPQRRRHEDSDDEDEPGSSHPTLTSSSKRPRLTPTEEDSDDDQSSDEDNGGKVQEREGEPESDDDGEQSETSEDMDVAGAKAIAQQPVVDHGVGPGGYKPGAIVRIKVTNFVTYTSAEFFPGPRLNMVIGPNGTGKSTLVCAICLGLGWGPQHLGRAKDAGEFVKHGCREATIEIELAGRPKLSHNPVVTRTIKRDGGNKGSFTLNGRASSNKEIRQLAQSFAIQVDNLCQFLPQDKVAEFAALTPIELLHSTQRAAAGPEMVEWHDGLKKLRGEQKRIELDNRADREMLKNLEDRQETQREVVERMRERDVIKQKMELLELIRPVVEYRDYHKEFSALKDKKAAIDQAYDRLKEELEPAMQSLNQKQGYAEKITAAKQYRKERVQQLSRVATRRADKIIELEDAIKGLGNDIEGERKSGQTHKQEATKVQVDINKLRRRQEEEVVEFDPEVYNERLKAKRLEKRELETKSDEIKARREPLVEQLRSLQRKKNQAEQQLQHLDSATGKQETRLQSTSLDSLKAWRWVRENQNKFEKEVFGPPIITCSVTDPKYADAMESLLQRTDFSSFTAQTRNDFRTLQRHLVGQLKLSDISIRTCSASLDTMTTPQVDIRSLGFDGWAKDFLSGPDPVIAMLCMEKALHKTPVGLNDISEAAFERMENGPLSQWVSGKNSYQVTRRREYGPGAQSTRVKPVRAATAWTSKPADTSLKQRCLEEIRQHQMEYSELESNIQSEKEEAAQVATKHAQVKKETSEIEAEKSAKQTEHTQWRAIPERLAQLEQKLKSFHELFAEVRERVHGMRNRQDEKAVEKAEATIAYADAVDDLRKAYEELMKAEMLHLEANSDVQTLRTRHADFAKLLEDKRLEALRISNEFKEATRRGRDMLKKAKEVTLQARPLEGGSEALESISAPDYNIDQLNADIDSKTAELEFTHGGNENMVQEFEQRERQIDRLKRKLSDLDQRLSDLSGAIDEVRQRWEPRLDALINKISAAFSDSFARIGCAGQVSLDKVKAESGPNDEASPEYEYDQWSIEIHVKFRENEQLALLNAHRQSGGERAVSTIFYLMALQSLSASPFRVVDEINQGMDPRNERMVHGRLVDIACASSEEDTDEQGNAIGGGGRGQYFLITPKLLSGLAYKPGMRVLCIYSGEHMPQDYPKLDFSLAIRNMKAIAAQSGRSIGSDTAQGTSSQQHVDVYA